MHAQLELGCLEQVNADSTAQCMHSYELESAEYHKLASHLQLQRCPSLSWNLGAGRRSRGGIFLCDRGFTNGLMSDIMPVGLAVVATED